MSRRSKTVAAAVVRQMMQFAETAGVSPDEFSAVTGVSPSDLADPAARIGRSRYERVLSLYQSIGDRAGSPWISILDGLSRHLPMLVGTWLNAPTKRMGLQAYLTYRPILGEFDTVVMRERDAAVRIEYRPEFPAFTEVRSPRANFQIIVELVRSYDQGTATGFSAELTGPFERSDEAFVVALRGKCTFGAAANTLEFHAADLDVPLPSYNPAVAAVLLPHLKSELVALERDASFSVAVERATKAAITGSVGALGPGMLLEQLSAELGVSRWTLHRKLAEDRTSFHAIWRSAREQEARRLLLETSLSMGEISDRLGFASQSSFTRFFRQVAGTSPTHVRVSRGDGR